MARCLLALGSNLGDRQAILAQACAEVASLAGCQLLARSRWHATVPIGGAAGQGDFLNGAILIETALTAPALAAKLQEIENRLGRCRAVRWDARPIDIDMLLIGTKEIETESLTVPHPRMAFRNFVLEPAVEIAGDMLHPTSGWTLMRLLTHLKSSPRYVIVTAMEKSLAERLVTGLSQKVGCPVYSATDEKITVANASPSAERGQFPKHPFPKSRLPKSQSGAPPVLAIFSPDELAVLATQQIRACPSPLFEVPSGQESLSDQNALGRASNYSDSLRPALVIAFDPTGKENNQRPLGNWLRLPGLGPLARITANDPATMLQEAEAALCCIWPDLLHVP